MDDDDKDLSEFGIIIDSESDDDVTVASTPVGSTTPNSPVNVPIRKIASSGALESLDKRRPKETRFSAGTINVPSTKTSAQNTKIDRIVEDDGWSLLSEDDGGNDTTEKMFFGPLPIIDSKKEATIIKGTEGLLLPPIHPSNPEHKPESDYNRKPIRSTTLLSLLQLSMFGALVAIKGSAT